MGDLIIRGQLLLPSGQVPDGAVLVRGSKIAEVYTPFSGSLPPDVEEFDAGGLNIAPGMIDSHTHGGLGYDFMTCTREQLDEILAWLPSTGVTSILPTLATSPLAEGLEMVARLSGFKNQPSPGANLVGLHLEGPFINPEKRGAQPADPIRHPSVEEMQALVAAGGDAIRLVTLAPELPGAMELVAYLVSVGIVASAGHSNATYEETLQAMEAGLNRVGHLFNAMPAFNHRSPGLVGAALEQEGIYAEVIMDGIHVHPAAARIAYKAKGLDRLILMSDATQAAGLGDGTYIRPGNRKIIVKDGAARLESGALAGSILTMDRALANASAFLDLPLFEAVQLGARNPAENLGLRGKGRLEAGCDADLIVFDDDVHIRAAFVSGRQVFAREEE